MKLFSGWEDAHPNRSSKPGLTPTPCAPGMETREIAEPLLELEDLNPYILGTKYGRTLLWWVAENDHEGIEKLLLGWSDANSGSTGKSGRTPFSWASWNG